MIEPDLEQPRSAPVPWWMPLVIIAAGLIAYCNSLTVPFLFDDYHSIVNNPSIRSLSNPGAILLPPPQIGVSGRPTLNLSLALNYSLSGLEPRGYHLVNIAIHLTAALVLFSLILRTLQSPRMRPFFADASAWIALAVSILWVVHPLNTMSVTYVIQRAESMVSLVYLLTLYLAARGMASAKPVAWFMLSIFVCALGMGCKEVMVTAPLAALLYDRAFYSASFRDALKDRWPLYLGLLLTEFVLVGLVAGNPRSSSAGFGLKEISVGQYLRTQPEVILHYLTLVLWPHPLCLDYDWPVANSLTRILPAAAAVLVMVGWSIRAALRGSPTGFLAALFFLILIPSSSIVPIVIPASEHRMYLPSAVVICLVVLSLYSVRLPRRSLQAPIDQTQAAKRRNIIAVAALITAGPLIYLTIQRNGDYQSELSIWADTVRLRPQNARAVNSLGFALTHLGRFDQSVPYYRQAISLKPQYADAHFNLAEDLRRLGRKDEALAEYNEALRYSPRDWQALSGRAAILAGQNKLAEAEQLYQQALDIRPDFSPALSGLGLIRASQGKPDEAIALYRRAVLSEPANAQLRLELGIIHAIKGDMAGAAEAFGRALQIDPSFTPARFRLALALAAIGQHRDAVRQYQQIVPQMAQSAELHCGYAQSLEALGQYAESLAELRKALELEPSRMEAKLELAWILATCPDDNLRRPQEAVELARSVCAATRNASFAALDTLAAAYAAAGQFDDAVKTAEQALSLAQSANQLDAQGKITERITLYRAHQPFRTAAKN